MLTTIVLTSLFSTTLGFTAGWFYGWVCGSRYTQDRQARIRRMLESHQIGLGGGSPVSSPTVLLPPNPPTENR